MNLFWVIYLLVLWVCIGRLCDCTPGYEVQEFRGWLLARINQGASIVFRQGGVVLISDIHVHSRTRGDLQNGVGSNVQTQTINREHCLFGAVGILMVLFYIWRLLDVGDWFITQQGPSGSAQIALVSCFQPRDVLVMEVLLNLKNHKKWKVISLPNLKISDFLKKSIIYGFYESLKQKLAEDDLLDMEARNIRIL